VWKRQLLALRVLDRLGSESLEELGSRLGRHPSPEVQRWLRDRRAALTRAAAAERIVTENGGIELLRIPGGTFLMGSPDTEEGRFDDEGPQHEVAVPSFYMGRYPVTNEEYARFLEANPDVQEPEYWSDRSYNQGRQPVVGVKWDEARRFAKWAGARLPSEAEWEYAARAGTTEPYLEGADEADLDRVAWYSENSSDRTHPVGEKRANARGLLSTTSAASRWRSTPRCWHTCRARPCSGGWPRGRGPGSGCYAWAVIPRRRRSPPAGRATRTSRASTSTPTRPCAPGTTSGSKLCAGTFCVHPSRRTRWN
jgi:formylglycine-generating enzyme required for sulfatase activity